MALDISRAFFRGESRLARDLAVLGADYALRGRSGRAAVVDAFAGSGARSLRYAADVAGGNVDVLANEPNDETALAANAAGFVALANTSCAIRVASGDATRKPPRPGNLKPPPLWWCSASFF